MDSSKKQLQQKQKRVIVYVGVLAYIIGIALLFNAREFARDTYVSENALQPASTNYYYDAEDYKFSIRFTQNYLKFQKSLSKNLPDELWSRKTAFWLVSRLRELGVEAYEEEFEISNSSSFTPSSTIRGWNVIGIVRAPRGDGVETLLFTTRYNRHLSKDGPLVDEISNVGFVTSLLRFFSRQHWLSKDYIFVFSPECFGEKGLKEWLDNYFSLKYLNQEIETKSSLLQPPSFSTEKKLYDEVNNNISSQSNYARGNIIAALNFNFETALTFDDFVLLIEGTSGHLPNLDLVNVITEVGWNQRVTEILFSKPNPLQNTIKSYIPSELHTLVTFLLNLAIGVPEDDHAILSQYNIDSLTVSNNRPHRDMNGRYNFLTLARVMEGAVRSLNNLIERFHQSYYYYLLVTELSVYHWTTFLSIGYYMIPFGLILLGFFGYSTFTLYCAVKEHLIFSLINALLAQCVGVFIFGIPLIIRRLQSWELLSSSLSHTQTLIWLWPTTSVCFVLFLFVIVYPYVDRSSLGLSVLRSDQKKNDKTQRNDPSIQTEVTHVRQNTTEEEDFSDLIECLKSFAMVPSCLFLSTFSLFNFSFCSLTALIYVPFFTPLLLLLRPKSSSSSTPFQYVIKTTSFIVFWIIAIVFGLFKFDTHSLWNLVESMIISYENYTTLFFPFLSLVLIPFTLMLLRIVLLLLSKNK